MRDNKIGLIGLLP